MSNTTELYIKMCDCPEIQGRHLEGGDFYAINGRTNIVKWSDQKCVSGGEGLTTNLVHHRRNLVIWLPRQDQLQEMVIPEPYHNWLNFEFFFYDFIFDEVTDGDYPYIKEPLPYSSKEQALLSFVMKEKFGKCWSGERWVST